MSGSVGGDLTGSSSPTEPATTRSPPVFRGAYFSLSRPARHDFDSSLSDPRPV